MELGSMNHLPDASISTAINATTEACETAHSLFGEPKLASVTPRVEFKRMHKVEAGTVRDQTGKVVDPNSVWDMKEEDIAMLDRIFKEALWMLDMVHESPRRSNVFKRAFKDHRYQCAILSILSWVRELLVSLVERECMSAVRPAFASKPLKIVMVETRDPVEPWCTAMISSETHIMYLWEDFAVDELRSGLRDAVVDSHRDAVDDLVFSRAAVMLHELVHYVSYLKRVGFCELTRCRRARRLIDEVGGDDECITDCKAIDFLFKKSTSDREIVEWFKETKKTRRGKKVSHGIAYGIDAVER